MDLIRDRGLYDANNADREIARKSVAGLSMLEDAGEDLIPNTYILFNDIIYKSKSGFGSLLKVMGNAYVGNFDGVNDAMSEIGGFRVTIKSYLYKLKWNDELAYKFYNDLYYEESNIDLSKKSAYEQHPELFELEFVGMTTSTASETSFVGVKNVSEAFKKISVRVIDRNIVDLQRSYPEFRIKAPLISVDPLISDIGLKEGITQNCKFEVLQPEVDTNGKLIYKRVGVIIPEEDKIKDNRYMSVEEGADNSDIEGTVFRKLSGGDFAAGMLIRELD